MTKAPYSKASSRSSTTNSVEASATWAAAWSRIKSLPSSTRWRPPMSRDCTRCHGFGEYMYAADSSGHVAYTSCPDCDGYGILPDDKGQSCKGSLVETCASTAIGFVVSLMLISL